jgi:flagellar basal body-associated protein FliL
MSEEQDRQHEKRSMRLMWIFSGVIVLLILGGMGLDMYFHPDAGKSPTDISSQSKQ